MDDGSEVGAEFDEREPLVPPRDEAWVAETFGKVGPAPSNDVYVNETVPAAPNVERPCEGEVSDD